MKYEFTNRSHVISSSLEKIKLCSKIILGLVLSSAYYIRLRNSLSLPLNPLSTNVKYSVHESIKIPCPLCKPIAFKQEKIR